ncbi:MAG: archease [Candidatus Methanoperedens sp.]|nr:archease [Candidatus Methanoperedens sp.]
MKDNFLKGLHLCCTRKFLDLRLKKPNFIGLQANLGIGSRDKMPYRFLEDIANGDAAFEAEARTLEELFREAAVATFEVMVDTMGVEAKITREVELKNEAVDGLLFDWLSELVYLKDAEAVLFSKFNVNIKKNDAIPKLKRQQSK